MLQGVSMVYGQDITYIGNMKKIIFFLALCCFIGLQSAKAQSSWGIEVGTENGIHYTRQLSKHWGIETRLGFELLDLIKLNQETLSPIIQVMPKRTFSAKSKSNLYQSGGYWGVHLYAKAYRLFGEHSVYDETEGDLTLRPSFSIGFEPNLGWVFGLNERSYIRGSIGMVLSWDRYHYPKNFYGDISFWEKPGDKSVIPVRIEATYSYRF